jgi:hypothetical protein
MNDMLNAVVIGPGCLALGAALVWSRERKRSLAAALSAFTMGLAFHSVYQHERLRHRWCMSWGHEER